MDSAGPAELAPWLAQALCKTAAGRREISARALPLSRAARNLLLIVDGRHSAGQWLALVRGCGPAELQQLLAAGLVDRVSVVGSGAALVVPGTAAAPAAEPASAAQPAQAPRSAGLPGQASRSAAPVPLSDSLETLGYQQLYDRLTVEARPQLGLIKGYKLILDIEKCAGPAELRQLARRFVEQLRSVKGDAHASALVQRLVDPG